MFKQGDHVRNALRFFASLTFMISAVLGIVIAVRAHWDFLSRHWGIIYMSFIVPMFLHLCVHIFERRTGKFKEDPWSSWTVKSAVPLGVVFALIFYGVMFLGFYEIYLFAFSPGLSKISSIVLVGFVTLTIGAMFFVLRLKWRFVYGISEACAGVVVASQRFYAEAIAGQMNSATPVILAILTAGVYLVVRGADNMHQGLTKEPLDPVGQKVLQWLERIGKGKTVEEFMYSPWNIDRPDKDQDHKINGPNSDVP